MIRFFKILILLLLFLFFSIPAGVCDFHPGYSVEPAMQGMDSGMPLDTVPVNSEQVPAGIMLIFLVIPISSLTGFPVELVLIIKLYTYLGYRKISQTTLFCNQSRNRIFSCIQENPGISYNDLVQRSKINRGTLRYHLKILCLMQRVTVSSGPGNHRYYENTGTFSGPEKTILKVLRNRTDSYILRLICRKPDLTRYEIAHELNLSASTVSWRMKRLADDNIIRIGKSGKRAVYRINSECQQILEKHLVPPADVFQSLPEGKISENG